MSRASHVMYYSIFHLCEMALSKKSLHKKVINFMRYLSKLDNSQLAIRFDQALAPIRNDIFNEDGFESVVSFFSKDNFLRQFHVQEIWNLIGPAFRKDVKMTIFSLGLASQIVKLEEKKEIPFLIEICETAMKNGVSKQDIIQQVLMKFQAGTEQNEFVCGYSDQLELFLIQTVGIDPSVPRTSSTPIGVKRSM